MTIELVSVDHADGSRTQHRELTETLDAVGSTDPTRLSGEIALQITGSATDVTVRVERTTLDPTVESNWGPAGDDIAGNPVAGIQCRQYQEPTRAWWRVRVVAIDAGEINIVLSGEMA